MYVVLPLSYRGVEKLLHTDQEACLYFLLRLKVEVQREIKNKKDWCIQIALCGLRLILQIVVLVELGSRRKVLGSAVNYKRNYPTDVRLEDCCGFSLGSQRKCFVSVHAANNKVKVYSMLKGIYIFLINGDASSFSSTKFFFMPVLFNFCIFWPPSKYSQTCWPQMVYTLPVFNQIRSYLEFNGVNGTSLIMSLIWQIWRPVTECFGHWNRSEIWTFALSVWS